MHLLNQLYANSGTCCSQGCNGQKVGMDALEHNTIIFKHKHLRGKSQMYVNIMAIYFTDIFCCFWKK